MIEIWDSEVRLDELLSAIPTTDELKWSITEFWGIAQDDHTDVVTLEQAIASSPTGLSFSAAQLRELSSRLLQLVDGIVVGYRCDPPARSDVDLRASSEVVIEAIDTPSGASMRETP
jgi:hypothetical protein